MLGNANLSYFCKNIIGTEIGHKRSDFIAPVQIPRESAKKGHLV